MSSPKLSLPPNVQSECQGHLHAELVHFEKYSPTTAAVAIAGVFEWWGEDSSAIAARPWLLPHSILEKLGVADTSDDQGRSTASWSVMCSPKGFANYLKDMRTLKIRLWFQPHLLNADIAEFKMDCEFGLCKINMLPYIRGADNDYNFRLQGCFDVVSKGEAVGALELRIWTSWAPHARLRPIAEVLSSFEQHELRAKVDVELPLQPRAYVPESSVSDCADAPGTPQQKTRNEAGTCKLVKQITPKDTISQHSLRAETANKTSLHRSLQGKRDADAELFDIHVRMELCSVCLRGSLSAMEVIYRMGTAQQISARITDHTSSNFESQGLIGSSVISSIAAWQFDVANQCVRGPAFSTIHLHLWRTQATSELVGLAKVSLPCLELRVAKQLHVGRSLLLSQTNVDICAIADGTVIGAIRVVLHAGSAEDLGKVAMSPIAYPAYVAPAEQSLNITNVPTTPLRYPAEIVSTPIKQVIDTSLPKRFCMSSSYQPEESLTKHANESHVSLTAQHANRDREWADEHAGLKAATLADFKITLANLSPNDVLVAIGGKSVSSKARAFPLQELCMALQQCVDGLTKHEADAFVMRIANALSSQGMENDVKQEIPMIQLHRAIDTSKRRIQSGIDQFVEEVGDRCGCVVDELFKNHIDKKLCRRELCRVLEQLNLHITWKLLEDLFAALDIHGMGDIPARSFAQLLAQRVEAWWRKRRPKESPDFSEVNKWQSRRSARALHHPVALKLLSSLGSALVAGEIDLNEATSILDFVAATVSARRQDLWCSSDSSFESWLAHVVDGDSSGVAVVVTAWHQLSLRVAATPAVLALASLARLEISSAVDTPLKLRVRREQLVELLEAYRAGTLLEVSTASPLCHRQMSVTDSPTSPWLIHDLRQRLFAGILSSGFRPENISSYLGVGIARHMSLDDFATRLQHIKVPLSCADIVLVGRTWSRDGQLQLDDFCRQYESWLNTYISDSMIADSMLGHSDIDMSSIEAKDLCNQFEQDLTAQDIADMLSPTPSHGFTANSMVGFKRSFQDLPCCVLFAFLEGSCQGDVKSECMLRFFDIGLGHCSIDVSSLSLSSGWSKDDSITYKRFYRYCYDMEQVYFSRSTEDKYSQLANFRVDVRNVVLELSGWSDAVGGLDMTMDADGMAQLFLEIGLPIDSANALLERILLLDAACNTASGSSISSLRTLRCFLGLMRQAREHHRSHVDALLGPCLTMQVDMAAVFTKASISPGEGLLMEELVALISAEGVGLAAVDLQEVSQALDMDCEGRILVAEVLRRYQELVGRHGAVLSQLADSLELGVPIKAIQRLTASVAPCGIWDVSQTCADENSLDDLACNGVVV